MGTLSDGHVVDNDVGVGDIGDEHVVDDYI